jgi:hypothetical protein
MVGKVQVEVKRSVVEAIPMAATIRKVIVGARPGPNRR